MTEANDRPPLPSSREDRARERMEARERRSVERAAMAQGRTDRRAAEREQASQERAARRAARMTERTEDLAARRPLPGEEAEPAPPKPKRRASGALRRTGDLRVERDVRQFRTVVDARRIRELARRGAKVDGLATVFKMTLEQIEAVLADTD